MSVWPYHCQEVIPFAGLVAATDTVWSNDIINCADNTYLFDKNDVYKQIFDYLQFFQPVSADLQNAFTAAAFLANEVWLMNPPGGTLSGCSMTVNFDHGTESRKPHVSLAGIVAVSLLLGAFLLSLLAIALYSFHSPRWTSQLDSFAMIRIGASIADQVSLKFVNNVGNVRLLDKMPGVMGGEASDIDNVDDLRLGALQPLCRTTLYSSIDRKLTPDEVLAKHRRPDLYCWGDDGVLRLRFPQTGS